MNPLLTSLLAAASLAGAPAEQASPPLPYTESSLSVVDEAVVIFEDPASLTGEEDFATFHDAGCGNCGCGGGDCSCK